MLTVKRYCELPERERVVVAKQLIASVLEKHVGSMASINGARLLRRAFAVYPADLTTFYSDVLRHLASIEIDGRRWLLVSARAKKKNKRGWCHYIVYRRI